MNKQEILKEKTDYHIQVDGSFWSIRSNEIAYDIELMSNSGGIQHNLTNDKDKELKQCCELVIASMINLHKLLDENWMVNYEKFKGVLNEKA